MQPKYYFQFICFQQREYFLVKEGYKLWTRKMLSGRQTNHTLHMIDVEENLSFVPAPHLFG